VDGRVDPRIKSEDGHDETDVSLTAQSPQFSAPHCVGTSRFLAGQPDFANNQQYWIRKTTTG
jgi:hypothetical protein